MTKKITYEKPMFFDLTGSDAGIAHGWDFLNCTSGKGAASMCKNGTSASGSCQNGKTAVTDCYNGPSAKAHIRCTSGQSATQTCSIGMGVRHS